jgi:hypothetical protein
MFPQKNRKNLSQYDHGSFFSAKMLIALHRSRLFTAIDDADWPLVEDVTWTLLQVKSNKYARGTQNGKSVLLHRMLLNAPGGTYVAHEDGNGLNNRRANLQLITKPILQNSGVSVSRVYKSRTGIYMKDGRWRAGIRHGGRYIVLGVFDTQREAMQARDYVSISIRPEFEKLHRVDLTGFDALKLSPIARRLIVVHNLRPSRSGGSRSRP